MYAVEVTEPHKPFRVLYYTSDKEKAIERAVDYDGNAASLNEKVLVVDRETGEVIWRGG